MHDHQALMVELEAAQKRRLAAVDLEDKLRRRKLSTVNLARLSKGKRFTSWKSTVSAQAIQSVRELFDLTTQKLIALGPSRTEKQVAKAIHECIERLNKLDRKFGYFICTEEREDLCEAISQLVHACGFEELGEIADQWRNW